MTYRPNAFISLCMIHYCFDSVVYRWCLYILYRGRAYSKSLGLHVTHCCVIATVISCKIFTSHKWPIQYFITYKKVFLSFQVCMMLPLELAQLLKKWCLKLKHESPHLIRFWKAYPSVHCSVKDAPCLTVVKWPSRSRSCMLLSRHAIFSCLDWRKGKQTKALNQC